MSFNKHFFNTESPTLYTRVGMIGLALVMVGFMIGILIDVAPAPSVSKWRASLSAPCWRWSTRR